MRFRWFLCVVLVALGAGAGDVSPPSAEGAVRWAVCGEWRKVPTPDLNTFQAGAVATVSPYEAWMVGNLTPDGLGDPVALRWDGQRWVRERFPTIARKQVQLSDVAVISPTEVWAVGARGDIYGLRGRPMAARWDGQRWRFVRIGVPGLSGGLMSVTRIGGSDDLWAVGYVHHGLHERPLAIRWNGSSWHRTWLPPVDRGPTVLQDVVATGHHAWAVGSIGNGDWTQHSKTLIERFNGQRWSRVRSPNPGDRHNALLAVDASAPDAVWAVGSFTGARPSRPRAMVLRWDGTTWRIARTLDRRSELRDVNVASPSDAWAVGVIGRRPLVLRRSGGPWSRSPAPRVDGWFTAIDGTPHNLWASMVDMNGMEHQFGWTTSWHRC